MCQLFAVILELQLPVGALANDEPINANADFKNFNAKRKRCRLDATSLISALLFGWTKLSRTAAQQRDNLVHRLAMQPASQLLNLFERGTLKFFIVCDVDYPEPADQRSTGKFGS